jgi:histidine triad (HIT) family protein
MFLLISCKKLVLDKHKLELKDQKEEFDMSTIFAKIINKEIPADIVYEDDLCLAFRDINPQAPVHILIIPKKQLPELNHAEIEDQQLLGQLMLAAKKIAAKEGVADAFRLVLNNGAGAGQEIFHMHFHLLAGRSFTWPPG